MKYLAIIFSLLPVAAVAQTQPTPGLGCTPGTHTFCVTTTADSGTGSLRQAMLDSDTAGGANTIGFQIPGSGPQTITLASTLPVFGQGSTLTSLTVDGYSQPGSVLNSNTPDQGGLNTKLMIEISGAGFGGFRFNCCGNPSLTITLQGLDLHGLSYVVLGQSYGNGRVDQWNVYGCFIGTTIDGTAATTPAGDGLDIAYDSAQIGGVQAWQRNLISGMQRGVTGGYPGETVIVEGNLIGTDITGTQAIPNAIGLQIGGNLPGLRVGCTGSGCTSAASRNVISGNGLAIEDFDIYGLGNSGAQIKGNYIGTDWTGAKPLPNGRADGTCPSTYCGGIETLATGNSGSALIVGGFNPGEANLIAWNNAPGIWNNPQSASSGLAASFDNRGNAVHNNAGVNVGFLYGWLANDPGDADTGVNNLQNYPAIQSASVSGAPGNLTLNVTYAVDSLTTNSAYPLRIDFYVDIDEGSGEYLGSDTYTASDATMPKSVSLPLPADVRSLVGFVVTATDANGYTSEISPSFVFDRIFADGFDGH